MFEWMSSLIPTTYERMVLVIGGFTGAMWGASFGHCQEAMVWFLYIIIADYITGMWAACKLGELSSSVGFRGLVKKFIIISLCALAHGLDIIIDVKFIQTAIVFGFALNEFCSVVENIGRCGYTGLIPDEIQKFLSELKKRPLHK